MSGFWNTSDGKKVEKQASYDAGNMEPIPHNTQVLAVVDEAKWVSPHENDDDQTDKVKIRWTVLGPKEYKGRVIFQKLKVFADKPTTRDKALKMLAAIDTNAGGKLSLIDGEPEDDDLMSALVNKQMILNLQVWEFGDNKGNWVSAVSPKTPPKKEAETEASDQPDQPAEAPKRTRAKPAAAAANASDMDDDIPF